VASLAIVVPAPRRLYLVDATPDLPLQLEALADLREEPAARADRGPLDGVFLTHAHIGHYLGLAHLGFEALNTSELPVFCTPRMASFLRTNGPWSQLVAKRNIEIRELRPDSALDLEGGVRVTAFAVPHRDEFSDTVAYRIAGPHRTLLYVPDTDAWEKWQPPLFDRLDGVDVALLDGTFHSAGELPGRDLATIPHPLIERSIALLEGRVRAGSLEVYFTHLNHSNPALDPDGPAREAIEARGFSVLDEGTELGL
jgi:pyrroloquinoline quinone biosynthesis protein B